MTAEKYAQEVEYIVWQAQNEYIDFGTAWQRLALLTVAYTSENPVDRP